MGGAPTQTANTFSQSAAAPTRVAAAAVVEMTAAHWRSNCQACADPKIDVTFPN